jgi:hypothetical protein
MRVQYLNLGVQRTRSHEDGNSMAGGRGPGIEDYERYEMLGEEGTNKEVAAGIANEERRVAVKRSARGRGPIPE